MRKFFAIVILVLIVGVWGTAYLYSINLRTVGIIDGKMYLRMAAKHFSEHGYVTNYGARSYQVWLDTNRVTIAGTQYQCSITTTNDKFYGEGCLSLTSNQLFIWIDAKRPAKLIGPNYRAQIFPPRF